MRPAAPPQALEDIRAEIDGIDDRLLELLVRRFVAVERVRDIKAAQGGMAQSPIRPGREALILRRLIAAKSNALPASLILRLWRAIISAATLLQAPLRIHIAVGLFSSVPARLILQEHFGDARILDHAGEAEALQALASTPGDVAVVALASPWIGACLDGSAGGAQAIACLPQLKDSPEPRLLIFGHGSPEPTGADETLIATGGALPAGLKPLWQRQIDSHLVASLPGFLARSDLPLALTIVGRYPSAIEVRA